MFLSLILCVSFLSFSQIRTISNAEAESTITRQDIINQGKSHAEKSGVIVLDFEGLGDMDAIMDFYAGGTSQQGFSGPDYGVEFSDNAIALIKILAGGSGNFMNTPSGVTALVFFEGQPYMNVSAGFDTGLSFFYSSDQAEGIVEIYDELGGTGNLLASKSLPALGSDPDLPYTFNRWGAVSVPFNGIAKSVVFGGVADQIGFDSVTFGSLTPGEEDQSVPVPVSNWSIYLTALLVGVFILFRIRKIL